MTIYQLTQVSIASQYLPFTYVDVHRSGRFSLTVPQSGAGANTVTAVEIADAGFGYTVAPTIIVNGVEKTGETITQAVVTCTIDSKGRINGAKFVTLEKRNV